MFHTPVHKQSSASLMSAPASGPATAPQEVKSDVAALEAELARPLTDAEKALIDELVDTGN